MDVTIDHPDFAALGLVLAIHDPQTDRPVSSGIARDRVWESFLTRQMLALVEAPGFASFYDLGANLGWHSALVAAHLRERGIAGHVVAVEPAAANLARLRRTLELNRLDVQVVAGAVGAADGRARLDHDPGNAGNHNIAGSGRPDRAYRGGEEVAVHRLETLVAANGWPAPRLVKMDVQGHEPQAVEGMGALMAEGPWVMALEWVPRLWSLEPMLERLAPDALFLADEQARLVLPATPGRLHALMEGRTRRYFDLLLAKGASAVAAVRELSDYREDAQPHWGEGFGVLRESGRRLAGAGAVMGVTPLEPGPLRLVLEGSVTRTFWEGALSVEIADADGVRTAPLEEGPFSLPLQLDGTPARLVFRLDEVPGGRRRHPERAFEVSHIEVHPAALTRPPPA